MARHAIYVRQFLCQLNPLCPARVNLQPDTFVGIYTPYQANTHRYRFLVIPAHGTDIIIERRLDDFQRSLLKDEDFEAGNFDIGFLNRKNVMGE